MAEPSEETVQSPNATTLQGSRPSFLGIPYHQPPLQRNCLPVSSDSTLSVPNAPLQLAPVAQHDERTTTSSSLDRQCLEVEGTNAPADSNASRDIELERQPPAPFLTKLKMIENAQDVMSDQLVCLEKSMTSSKIETSSLRACCDDHFDKLKFRLDELETGLTSMHVAIGSLKRREVANTAQAEKFADSLKEAKEAWANSADNLTKIVTHAQVIVKTRSRSFQRSLSEVQDSEVRILESLKSLGAAITAVATKVREVGSRLASCETRGEQNTATLHDLLADVSAVREELPIVRDALGSTALDVQEIVSMIMQAQEATEIGTTGQTLLDEFQNQTEPCSQKVRRSQPLDAAGPVLQFFSPLVQAGQNEESPVHTYHSLSSEGSSQQSRSSDEWQQGSLSPDIDISDFTPSSGLSPSSSHGSDADVAEGSPHDLTAEPQTLEDSRPGIAVHLTGSATKVAVEELVSSVTCSGVTALSDASINAPTGLQSLAFHDRGVPQNYNIASTNMRTTFAEIASATNDRGGWTLSITFQNPHFICLHFFRQYLRYIIGIILVCVLLSKVRSGLIKAERPVYEAFKRRQGLFASSWTEVFENLIVLYLSTFQFL